MPKSNTIEGPLVKSRGRKKGATIAPFEIKPVVVKEGTIPVSGDVIIGGIAQLLGMSDTLQKGEIEFINPPVKILFYYNYKNLLHFMVSRRDKKYIWEPHIETPEAPDS